MNKIRKSKWHLVAIGLVGIVLVGLVGTKLVPQKNQASVEKIDASQEAGKAENPESKGKEMVGDKAIANPSYVDFVSEKDIIRDTKDLGGVYSKYYTKYISYRAPNGKPITIVAQDKVTDAQILKAYNMLSFYLTDHKDMKKEIIANNMANQKAVLVMPNGADGQSKIPGKALQGQPLYEMEVPATGSQWYMKNDYEHRDAAFEEILHMVHDYGIGTVNSRGANPELQQEIYKATMAALPKDKGKWGKEGLWGLNSKDWLVELEKEGSLEQEYLASVVDSYYGLWEAFKENDGGMWGIYVAKNREAIGQKDPTGLRIVEEFMPKYLTQLESIDPSFQGTFYMTKDAAVPYTAKSMYLQKVRLMGSESSSIQGNALDNVFMGNSGVNYMDGMAGKNVVQFIGSSDGYEISSKLDDKGYRKITDLSNKEGTIYVKNIQVLRFIDQDIQNN